MAQDTVKYEEIDDKERELPYYRLKFWYVVKGRPKPSDISSYVKSIYCEEDYEIQKMPLMKVVLELPKKFFLDMFYNQENFECKLSVKRYKKKSKNDRDKDTTMPLEEEPMDELTYFDDVTLKPIGRPFKKIEQDNDKGDIEEGKDDRNVLDGNDGDVSEYMPNYRLELYLFKKEHLEFNRMLNSYVFHNTNLATVLLYLYQRNTQSREDYVYIGKLDNNQKYEQIIIPPLNFFDAIDYLQRVYGLYKNGVQVFASWKHFWVEDKLKVIKIPCRKEGRSKCLLELYSKRDKDTDNTRSNLKWFSKKKGCYICRTTQRPIMNNKNSENQELQGENTTIYSTNLTKHFETSTFNMREGHLRNVGGAKESFLWNPYSNHDYGVTEYKRVTQRNYFSFSITIPDSCLEAFIPNREYIVKDYAKNVDLSIFQRNDKYYNVETEDTKGPKKNAKKIMDFDGSYKLVSNRFMITNHGGPQTEPLDCTVLHSLVFKKIDKKD